MQTEEQRLYEESQQLIVKSNDLILKTHYSLTVIEMKIVAYLMSKIIASDTELSTVNISIKDFCRLCNIEPKGANYEQIRKNIRTLKRKDWWIQINEQGDELLYSWIDFAVISKNKGNIEIALSQSLKPFLLQLRSKYTKVRLEEVLKLKSKASIRLLEICYSQLYKGSFTISVDKFKKLMDIKDKYPAWRDLRKRIIDPSINEINENCFIHIEYEAIKNGKKIEKLKFNISEAMYQISIFDEE